VGIPSGSPGDTDAATGAKPYGRGQPSKAGNAYHGVVFNH